MKGSIKWFAGNHVAANILMFVFIVGGFLMAGQVDQEVFPEIQLDLITVTMQYPGAGPLEVEDGIIRPIEQAIGGLENIKRINGKASEGRGVVTAELIEGADINEVLDNIKSEVDRVQTFPEEAEDPVVAKVTNRREAISLVVYGDASDVALRQHAERIQDDLLALPNITQVELAATRPYEISIEIPEQTLRSLNLTLNEVAGTVRQASLDLAGGLVKTEGGEILLRTKEKRYEGQEFENITVLTRPDGGLVKLGDIATVKDGFEDIDKVAMFDGKPAVMIKVFRVGKQTPKEVATTVRNYIAEHSPTMPASIKVDVWQDFSILLDQRLDLLINNGYQGLLLLLIIIGLFLEVRLAFWVAMGIPVSFLGAILLLPMFDISINMLSLFAFILALGLVLDDAIVIGENVHVHREMGKSLYRASVDSTLELAMPITFSILTTVAAFLPMIFVTGAIGKFMYVVPVIMISVLIISLIDSFYILPAHLCGGLSSSNANIWKKIESVRHHFDDWVNAFSEKYYQRLVRSATAHRYTTIAIATAVMFAVIGVVGGGLIKFVFMPEIDADEIVVSVAMPPGTPVERTEEISRLIERKGLELASEYDARRGDTLHNVQHVFIANGFQTFEGGPRGLTEVNGAHLAQIRMLFRQPDERNVVTTDFADEWRERVGDLPGVDKVTFQSELIKSGADVGLQLSHEEFDVLLEATERLKTALAGYNGVSDIGDSHAEGKRELQLTLRPEARTLGVTERDLAQQVRSAFFGAEALRMQRGRNEVKVMVRYPEDERQSLTNVEHLHVRTRMGGEVPLTAAAGVDDGVGYSEISRTDRKRVVQVTASVNEAVANPDEIMADLQNGLLIQMKHDYPGLGIDLEGESRDRAESMGSLLAGFLFALFLIYGLLAIPFKSFTQPLIVMSVIPFGFVGAVIGHLIYGYNLSLMSVFGLVALAGVVVNGALVLIDMINTLRDQGVPIREAVLQAGVRRFRPILLTMLTTFFGLLPLMSNQSVQAQFLIPMAISLAFGEMATTFIVLIVIPALYLILEDVHDVLRLKGRHYQQIHEEFDDVKPAAAEA